MKRVIILLLVSFISLGLWASGNSETAGNPTAYRFNWHESNGNISGLRIEASDDITAIFADNGVDAGYVNARITEIPGDVKNDIDYIISTNADGVIETINSELQDRLESGEADYVCMLIGRKLFEGYLN